MAKRQSTANGGMIIQINEEQIKDHLGGGRQDVFFAAYERDPEQFKGRIPNALWINNPLPEIDGEIH